MVMKRKVAIDDTDARNSPAAWFVVLERARQESDFELAAKAESELKRLGVVVKYQTRGKHAS